MMMQRRMSQEHPIHATETEFVQRLQRLTVLAVNRLIYLGRVFVRFCFASAVPYEKSIFAFGEFAFKNVMLLMLA